MPALRSVVMSKSGCQCFRCLFLRLNTALRNALSARAGVKHATTEWRRHTKDNPHPLLMAVASCLLGHTPTLPPRRQGHLSRVRSEFTPTQSATEIPKHTPSRMPFLRKRALPLDAVDTTSSLNETTDVFTGCALTPTKERPTRRRSTPKRYTDVVSDDLSNAVRSDNVDWATRCVARAYSKKEMAPMEVLSMLSRYTSSWYVYRVPCLFAVPTCVP